MLAAFFHSLPTTVRVLIGLLAFVGIATSFVWVFDRVTGWIVAEEQKEALP